MHRRRPGDVDVKSKARVKPISELMNAEAMLVAWFIASIEVKSRRFIFIVVCRL
jgi:hypothetical protein